MFKKLENILKSRDKYISEDGELLKAAVYSDVMTMDKELLSLLLSDETIKNAFFTDIDGTLVFDKQKFAWLIDSKEFLPDSYTSYTNKIGLTSDREFISAKNDVVLDFPYKDCVLEGGQDKEDQKRDEIMYNETLASDEIRNMLAPKVFTNAKRYTADGETDLAGQLIPDSITIREETGIEFNDDDNLIIKGNNLIALSSLLKRYEDEIKCVFIDPPYYFIDTKPTDSFSYNSNFKLSSWLVFVKNRLLESYRLLKADGLLFITISDEGAHYLKVLCDEIFDMKNFIADVTWESRSSISSDGLFSINGNHILVYAKDKTRIEKNDFRLALDIESFKYDDEDGKGRYRLEPFDAPKIRKNLEYPIKNPNTGEIFYPPKGRHWRTTEENYKDLLKENRIKFGVMGNARPQYKAYYDEVKDSGKGRASSTIWDIKLDSIVWKETNTNTSATKHQQELFGEEVFTNPKPEALIERILQLSTSKNDIVLDFFMGSATTQVVALKMNRRFIGVEQMDYVNDVSLERLKKVLKGEQGGISKDVNWQGGGSFVYCELKENAQELIDIIQEATEDNISDVKNEIYNDKRIIPYLTSKELLEADEDFKVLSLEDKKKALIRLIDKNKLYVNYSDIDNEDFDISEEDKKFTESFYKVN